MTDAATLDDARAARLAALRERRGQHSPAAALAPPERAPEVRERADRLARLQERRPPTVVAAEATHANQNAEVHAAVATNPPTDHRATSPRQRRSPATNAKIVTVGASVTAMFGMIAGFGIADGTTADGPEPETSAVDGTTAATPVDAVPPASPTTTPALAVTPTEPQVIVVVIDGSTGRTLSTTNGTGDLAADLVAAGVDPETVPTPTPVVTPAAVELAVPVPPPPPPQQTRQAAPAPAPQATSSGS